MNGNSSIVASLLDKYQMNQEERERLQDLIYFHPGLIVSGYHHYIYGAAGSGKTTLMIYLSIEMCRQQEDIEIFYFYLDGTMNMASKASSHIEECGLNNRIKLLTKETALTYKQILTEILKSKEDLSNIIFIYDTFKYLTIDINVKNSNKEAMHFIKEFTKRGATFISIGHTNKDGVKQSGTAEIEQDSDALLRIDGVLDKDGTQISTIKKGGRSRMDVIETSFKFKTGEINSVQRLDEVVEIDKTIVNNSQEQAHKHIINAIIELIRIKPLKQSEIIKKSKSHPILASVGQNKLGTILKQYTKKYWQVNVGQNNSHFYTILENYTDGTLLN